MYFIKSPLIVSYLSQKYLIWNIPSKEKKIFLTFDDGPTPDITLWILDLLKKYNAYSTFFCVGENVQKHHDIFFKIIKEGHSVGNHTYNHLNAFKTNNKDYFNNINKAQNLIKSSLFRPPYGKLTITQIKHIKKSYDIVLWSVLSADFDKKISKEKCLNNVLKNSTPGSIVVFHDSVKAFNNLYYTLPRFIEHFLEKGYTFSNISLKEYL